jgi:hypothetical protein
VETEEENTGDEHREGLRVDIDKQMEWQHDGWKAHTIRPRASSRYFQPRFLSKSQGAGKGSQEFLGIRSMATRAESTAPMEKNNERAVTRYSFPRGICSRRSVPSVGSEPFQASTCGKKSGRFRKETYPNGAT